ncbi:MAG: hypothetical protein Q8N85_04570, partial [Candidatus Omnitrophota bacterium]|nr:hypothetical protein [Candidatus Omnitrophota bacterium]
QRTDTFSAPNRSDASKTEIHIVNGPDNYLIDPVNHTTVQENLLVKYNLTLSQLEELDEIYHPQAFLSRHLVIRRDNPQDLSQGLVQIDAFAKNPTQGNYLGYGMKIDFFKGLKVKSMLYLKEYDEEIEDKTMKLKQLIELTDSQKMPNGAWVPKAEVRTFYAPSGEIRINYNFENIRVNSGLSEGLFDPAGQ